MRHGEPDPRRSRSSSTVAASGRAMTRAQVSTALAVSPDSGLPGPAKCGGPVAEGIHRIPLPLPMDALRAVNVYVIETGSGLTLIDGGWGISEARGGVAG